MPYILPYLLAWVIPAGLLAGCVMTYGRLSAENELTAVCASGVPLRYMCYPAFLVALLLTTACIPLNDQLIPYSRSLKDEVLRNAFLAQPFRVSMLSGQETIKIGDYKIYVESVQDGVLNKVVVIVPKEREGADATDGAAPDDGAGPQKPDGRPPRDRTRDAKSQDVHVYRAREARYWVDEASRTIHIRLKDAQDTIVTPERNARSWVRLTADQQDIVIPTDDPSEKLREKRSVLFTQDLLQRARGTERELRLAASSEVRRTLERRLTQTLTEVHLREALAFSAVALCLVGVPLGIWMRRESRLASFAVAVLVFVFLYALTIGGEGLALAGKVPPRLALWTPDLLTGALGAAMLVRTFRR